MGRNPDWFDRQRLKGICYICKRSMEENDPNQAHVECSKLRGQGYTYAEIQERVGAKNGSHR